MEDFKQKKIYQKQKMDAFMTAICQWLESNTPLQSINGRDRKDSVF